MSSSIKEKVAELQQKLAAEEADRKAREKQRELEEERKEAEYRTRLKSEAIIVKTKQKEALDSVLPYLRETEQLVSVAVKHHLLISPDHTWATLVWGKRYSITRDGNVDYDRGIFGLSDGVRDFSSISVSAQLDGAVDINGRQISQLEWRKDPQQIIAALAESYVNPHRFDNRESEPEIQIGTR